ncbi:MAG: hypothetical protein VX346_14440 [Planctomycetota bacterium]|nr:hypothetical protein [Planctomycetota bacterium]
MIKTHRTAWLPPVLLPTVFILVLQTCAADNNRPHDKHRQEHPVARLRREGIRAMTSGDPKTIAQAGFNTTLPWERPLSGAKKSSAPNSLTIVTAKDFSRESVDKLRDWARKCKQENIIMMYMMYVAAEHSVRMLTGLDSDLDPGGHLLNYIGYGGRDTLNPKVRKIWPAHQYRHVVDWNGQPARWAPCPLERRYWLGLIKPQLELVARALQETGASGGAALELETCCFYSIYPGMASQKKTFCYCDHCFYDFVRSVDKSQTATAVLPRVRFDWLTQRGLLLRYEQHLEDSMTEIIREMVQSVRKIDPDFLLGMYPYAPFWYYDALIRGSGTPELPCLLFPSAEYSSGFTREPRPTFFGDTATPDSVRHLRRRKLPALYAGGIWFPNSSSETLAMAADRLTRSADGFWMYNQNWNTDKYEAIWKQHPNLMRLTKDLRGALPKGDRSVDCIETAREWTRKTQPIGISVSGGNVVASYDGEAQEVPIIAANFENAETLVSGWEGRGELPPRDDTLSYTGTASLRFEPSVEQSAPMSPYIDQKVPEARKGQEYELSFWTKAAGVNEPSRLWVGRADSGQWPNYMIYTNFMLPPGREWTRVRTAVSYHGTPPLVMRFWCPPTKGKVWLDAISLKPIQTRTIDISLTPPPGAAGWGAVHWKLTPQDARCAARVVDPETGQDLSLTVYSGDSLTALEAIVGLKPVTLRLELYPSPGEPVALDAVKVRYTLQD